MKLQRWLRSISSINPAITEKARLILMPNCSIRAANINGKVLNTTPENTTKGINKGCRSRGFKPFVFVQTFILMQHLYVKISNSFSRVPNKHNLLLWWKFNPLCYSWKDKLRHERGVWKFFGRSVTDLYAIKIGILLTTNKYTVPPIVLVIIKKYSRLLYRESVSKGKLILTLKRIAQLGIYIHGRLPLYNFSYAPHLRIKNGS